MWVIIPRLREAVVGDYVWFDAGVLPSGDTYELHIILECEL